MAQDVMTNPAVRKNRIKAAWAAYDGDAPRPLRIGSDGSDDNVRVNLARHLADTYTSWLVGRDVGIDTDATLSGRSPIEAIVDAQWPAEKRAAAMMRLRTEGAVTGDAFARVIPGRVIPLPSDAVTVVVDPVDAELVLRYVVEHDLPTPGSMTTKTMRQSHIRQDDGTWLVRDELIVNGGRPALVGETPWPYTLPQIAHCQNLPSVWPNGEPDLTPDLLDLVAAYERALSNAAKMTRLTSSPKPYSYGLDEDAQRAYNNAPAGATIHLADRETQELGLVEVSGAGLTSALALADKLASQFYALTGIPDPESADGKLTDTSGAALELRHATMVQRVEAMRRTYGGLITGVVDRLLAFSGFEPVPVKLTWPDLFPTDPDAAIARAQALAALGASRETVLRTAGLDPEVEAARLDAERPADIGGLLASLNVAADGVAA